MRITITINDHLLSQVKRRASESESTVSQLVEQALRLFMRPPSDTAKPEKFELITYGAGGNFTPYNMDKTSAILELDDIERYGPKK